MTTENYRYIVTSIPPENAVYIKPYSIGYCMLCIGKLENIFGSKYEDREKTTKEIQAR